MAKIAAEKKAVADAKFGGNKEESKSADPNSTKFDIKDLQNGIPEGVDPSKKELYLSSEQFLATFGMNEDKFAELKEWKKKDLKKSKGLF